MNTDAETQVQEDFKRKRRTFWLLVAAFLAIAVIRLFTEPAEESSVLVEDFIFFGGLIAVAASSWRVFRCPACQAALPQSFALPWRKDCRCKACGVHLAEG